MPGKRVSRVNELLRHEIANGLYNLQTDPPLDLARVTVASVECTTDLRKAKVYVSVLETEDLKTDDVVRLLNRHRNEFQKLIASNIVLKYTPHIQFVTDYGQAQADRIYQILDALPPVAEDESDESPET